MTEHRTHMKRLLHISDTHFGTEQEPVVEALVRLAHAQPYDLVILSGDITQRARGHQFRAARAFIDRLGAVPVLAIPGNHDIALFNLAERFLWPYRGYRRHICRDLEPEFESDRLLALAVNTTRRYRHIDGEISDEQVERVARRLESARSEQLRLVVTHQPVCVNQDDDVHNLLRGHERAVRRWGEAGADLILGGHIHLPFVCALHERTGVRRPFWVVNAGTAVSRRIRYGADNSVNQIRYRTGPGERHCVIERWDWRQDLLHFAPVTHHELNLAIA